MFTVKDGGTGEAVTVKVVVGSNVAVTVAVGGSGVSVAVGSRTVSVRGSGVSEGIDAAVGSLVAEREQPANTSDRMPANMINHQEFLCVFLIFPIT